MDEIVMQAIGKWPNVPACYGWLGLDARGRWFIRDEITQQVDTFPRSKGALLEHQGCLNFIARNYAHDKQNYWYFQNGPQRVFVELEVTPWVYRFLPDNSVITHTGVTTTLNTVLEDEQGCVYFTTPLGIGILHSQDMYEFAEWLEGQPQVKINKVIAGDIAQDFGYVLSPSLAHQNHLSETK